MQEDIKITKSNGLGKYNQLSWYVRPLAECFNRSRKVSGFNGQELREKANKLIAKWYSPKVIIYDVDGSKIGSNSKENALKEYWRVCEREKIGQQFEVKISKQQ